MVSFNIEGQERRLVDVELGSDQYPIRWGGAITTGPDTNNHRVGDMIWAVCHSGAGLSGVPNTGNPDINYARFSDFNDTFSGPVGNNHEGGLVSLVSKGSKCYALVEKLCRHSHSFGWQGFDGRLAFDRRHGTRTVRASLDNNDFLNARYKRDFRRRATTQRIVRYNESGDLMNSTGWSNPQLEGWYPPGFERTFDDSEIVWDSDNWIYNMARQMTGQFDTHLYWTSELEMGMYGMAFEIGDVLAWTDSDYHISPVINWTIMGHTLDTQTMKTKLEFEQRTPVYET
jgi:hypothetical protein